MPRNSSISRKKAYIAKSRYAHFPPGVIIAAIVLVILYLIVTTLIYSTVEQWSFWDALYFTVITMSTVGYGDIRPITIAGKVANLIFILGSFFGVFVLITLIFGYLVDHQIAAIIQRVKAKKKQQQRTSKWTFGLATVKSAKLDALADEAQQEMQQEVDKEIQEGRNVKWIVHLLLYALWLLMWTLFFTLHPKERHNFFDAFYFGVVTSSTIGYGQFTPHSLDGRIFCLIVTLIGTIFLTLLAGSVSQGVLAGLRSMFKKKGVKSHAEQQYQSQLETILDFAKSGKGQVDRFDFVMEMLIAQQTCKRNAVKKLCAEFDRLDVNDDGVLDEKDFELYKQNTFVGTPDDYDDADEIELANAGATRNAIEQEEP